MARSALAASICLLALAGTAVAQRATLTLERAGAQGPDPRRSANPSEADHALALYREDQWNRALACPEQRAAVQPDDPHRIRCELSPVAVLATGPLPLTVALSTTHHEHDGMYGMDEDVVVLAHKPNAPEPIVVATVTQLSFDVVDSGTTFRMRRQRVVDLDRDGSDDLCIESVEETGPGLFAIMDLRGRPFRPRTRTRGIDAWSVSLAGELVRRPALDGRCPPSGYRPFVAPGKPSTDPVERRRAAQGEARGDVVLRPRPAR